MLFATKGRLVASELKLLEIYPRGHFWGRRLSEVDVVDLNHKERAGSSAWSSVDALRRNFAPLNNQRLENSAAEENEEANYE